MIRVREVSLIGSDGEQLGVFPTQEALNMAEEKGQDLVEAVSYTHLTLPTKA